MTRSTLGVYSLSGNNGSSTRCSLRSITVNATDSGVELSRTVRIRCRSSVVLPDLASPSTINSGLAAKSTETGSRSCSR